MKILRKNWSVLNEGTTDWVWKKKKKQVQKVKVTVVFIGMEKFSSSEINWVIFREMLLDITGVIFIHN